MATTITTIRIDQDAHAPPPRTVAGNFVEGHVPASDIKRLLAEKPDAKGLVLAGMPLGSPGMEVPDGTVQPYTVEIIDQQGEATAFARH